ncbi:MAG: DNA repair protein RecO [Ferrovibrio sp.]|uniref:DNA repair protein RecO n=1 Tax=Ferrovibrio sp. TaxID=1917215 RepID=UPI0026191F7A|nr:DNA repair protein RecO [Ferrovibrio sp.]MCW0233419.1 DNA repair protein RecO [Ferrovibrio sp.]
MDWQDEGVVLSVRHHGESARIVTLLTEAHGRHAGLLRGSGTGRGGALQPGQIVRADWRARLSEQLGYYTLESLGHPAALMLDDPARLAALRAACALIDAAVSEREPHPNLFAATRSLFSLMAEMEDAGDWGALYVRWEIGLLAEMGYGIDLQSCAATGATVDLTHVSPRTGRAVSAGAAAPYAERLLVLPGFLVPGRGATDSVPVDSLQPDSAIRAVQDGLALTGHFLENRLFAQLHAPVPQARARLLEVVRGQAQTLAQK